jgi:hypothetical protein
MCVAEQSHAQLSFIFSNSHLPHTEYFGALDEENISTAGWIGSVDLLSK